MARVNVEQKALSDRRFHTLGRLTGESRHAALGRMILVWNECQERETYILTSIELDDINPDAAAFSVAVVESGLARHEDGGIYICGTRGRIEWLKNSRANGKKGAKYGKKGGRPTKPHDPFPPKPPVGLSEKPPPAPALDSGSKVLSPKKEKVGSKTTSSSARKETDDDAAEKGVSVVTEVIRRLCPQMKGLQRRNVLGWMADYADKGPWWISAALMEGNGTMARARSPGYIGQTLRSRLDDEFSCPDAEAFVRHRLKYGFTVAEIAEFQKQRQKPDSEATK